MTQERKFVLVLSFVVILIIAALIFGAVKEQERLDRESVLLERKRIQEEEALLERKLKIEKATKRYRELCLARHMWQLLELGYMKNTRVYKMTILTCIELERNKDRR